MEQPAVPLQPSELAKRQAATDVRRKERSLWRDAWSKLIANRLALASVVILSGVFIIAIVGPYITPYDHLDQDWEHIAEGPSLRHLLGTDELGRDMLSRIMAGGRTAVIIASITTVIRLVLGLFFGGVAAYFGSWVDSLVIRLIDLIQSFPSIMLVIFLVATLRPAIHRFSDALVFDLGWQFARNTTYLDFLVVFVVLGLTGWTHLARLVRGQILSLREQDYIMAAQVAGTNELKIILRHLIPNSLGPVVVSLSAGFGTAMLTEASLSYLGIGIQPPAASWGYMISENLIQWRFRPHLVMMPGAVLFVVVLATSFLGDGLNDALNPRFLTPSKKEAG